jgi:hypothetical protein
MIDRPDFDRHHEIAKRRLSFPVSGHADNHWALGRVKRDYSGSG